MKTSLSHRIETLSNMSLCTQEEAEERYERVVVSSLGSVEKLLLSLPSAENARLLHGISISETGSDSIVAFKPIVWKKMNPRH